MRVGHVQSEKDLNRTKRWVRGNVSLCPMAGARTPVSAFRLGLDWTASPHWVSSLLTKPASWMLLG